MKALASDTVYRFRVSAINKFGQSPYSWATVEVRTKKEGGSMILLFFFISLYKLKSRHTLEMLHSLFLYYFL